MPAIQFLLARGIPTRPCLVNIWPDMYWEQLHNRAEGHYYRHVGGTSTQQRPVCICGVGSLMAHSRDWGSQVRVPRHASRSEIQCTRILSGDQPSLRRVCEGRRDDGCVHYGRDAACPNANSPKRWVPSTTLSFRSSSTDEVVFHRTAIWFGLTPWGSSPVNLFWDSCPITTL